MVKTEQNQQVYVKPYRPYEVGTLIFTHNGDVIVVLQCDSEVTKFGQLAQIYSVKEGFVTIAVGLLVIYTKEILEIPQTS